MSRLLASPAFLFGLELFLKSSLVLLLGLALSAALRGRSAALRHFLLTVFLVGLLALPFLSRMPGGWMLRILPAARIAPEPARPSTVPAVGIELMDGGAEFVGSGPMAVTPAAAEPLKVRPVSLPTGPVPSNLPTAALLVTWLLGAALLLGRLVLGLAAARRWTREGRPLVHPDWRVLLARFKTAVSLKRSVLLRRHDRVAVPFTWGLWRPAVLMPGAAEDWSEDEMSTALFHELAHIKRVAYLIAFLARLSLAVYWLNPLTWVVFRVLRREQEKACDELVLKAGIKPSTYAENLLSFRSRMGSRWSPAEALLGLFGRTSFSDRLAAILDSKLNSTEVHMKTKGILIVVVVLTLALVGLAHPAGPASDKAPKPAAVAAAASAPAEVAAPAAQTAPAVAQEPEKEKKDNPRIEKDVVKKIVFVPGPEHKGRIEVKVTRGDKVEAFVADGTTVNIKTDAKGKAVIVTSGGKEIELGDGAQVRIEVRNGDWSLHKEKEVIRLDKGDVFHVTTDGHPAPEGVTIIEVPEHAHVPVIVEAAPHAEAVPPVEAVPYAHATPARPALPAIPPPADNPVFAFRRAPHAETYYVVASDKGVEEKLKQIREQLKQVKEKKLSLDELDKSLAALEETLKQKKEVREVAIAPRPLHEVEGLRPLVIKKHRSVEGKEGEVTIARPFIASDRSNQSHVELTVRDKDGVTMVFKAGKVGKDQYAALVDKVTKALPQGYSLEPSFDEEGKSAVLTIKNPKGSSGEDLDELVDKISDIIDREIK